MPTATRALRVIYQTLPGSQGGVEWNCRAYSRDMNLIFVNAIDWRTTVRIANSATLTGKPGDHCSGGGVAGEWRGSGRADPAMAFGKMDPFERAQGWLTARENLRWRGWSPRPEAWSLRVTSTE